MLISVIIPFLNMEDFLEEAIRSVINQNYIHWEILLIDDGSTDKSSSIAIMYANNFPNKIKYLFHENHQNKGLTCSRNLGLRIAKGEYIALLDADDVWLSDKLSEQVQIAKTFPKCALIAGPSIYWHSWKELSKEDEDIQIGQILDQIIKPPILIFHLYPFGKNSAPCPSSLMIKTENLKRLNGFEETFKGIYQMYEDQALLTKLYLYEECYISSISHSKYRQRPNGLVSNVNEKGKYRQVRSFFLKWFENYLKVQSVSNNQINQILKMAIFENRNPRISRWFQLISKVFIRYA